jgi:hypothetical protein
MYSYVEFQCNLDAGVINSEFSRETTPWQTEPFAGRIFAVALTGEIVFVNSFFWKYGYSTLIIILFFQSAGVNPTIGLVVHATSRNVFYPVSCVIVTKLVRRL